jgi:hypothetical protein
MGIKGRGLSGKGIPVQKMPLVKANLRCGIGKGEDLAKNLHLSYAPAACAGVDR